MNKIQCVLHYEAYIAEVVDTEGEAFVKTKLFVEEVVSKNQLALRG